MTTTTVAIFDRRVQNRDDRQSYYPFGIRERTLVSLPVSRNYNFKKL